MVLKIDPGVLHMLHKPTIYTTELYLQLLIVSKQKLWLPMEDFLKEIHLIVFRINF